MSVRKNVVNRFDWEEKIDAIHMGLNRKHSFLLYFRKARAFFPYLEHLKQLWYKTDLASLPIPFFCGVMLLSHYLMI